QALVRSQGGEFSFKHQDIPGAPLRWQWEEKDRQSEFEPNFGGRYHLELPKGEFNTLVLIDSVPRGGPEQMAETVEYLGRFVEFARQYQPEVRVYFAEAWHDLHSGTERAGEHDTVSPTRRLRWRERLDADAAMWEEVVRLVNERHPGAHPVRLIPCGRVLGALHDALGAGEVPGWTKVEDLFSDDIHLNLYGKYALALAYYAVLTGRSPVGLPSEIKNVWGGAYWGVRFWDGSEYPPMGGDTVRALQEVVARSLGMPR
ncbi:MAG: hypothetical protein SNJ84_09170, partial [Verrucomicrobiia bacterium]